VQKSKIIVLAAVLTACLTGLAVTAGCSESKSRRAGRRLLDKAAKAERLCNRAIALLADPVYKIGEDYAPIELKARPGVEDITVLPAGQLHPGALRALGEAEKVLSDTLADKANAAAGPAEKAVVHVLLARVLALKAHCESLAGFEAIERADLARQQAERVLVTLGCQCELLGYYGNLASISDEDLPRDRTQAENDRKAIAEQIKEIRLRIARLSEEKAAQSEKYKDLNARARELTIEARLGTSREGLAKLEEALEIQSRANAAESEVSRIESEIDLLNAKSKVLEIDLAAAKAKTDSIEESLAGRKAQRERNEVKVREVRARLATMEESLISLLAKMATACEQMLDSHRRAGNAYELALHQLKKAPAGQAAVEATRANILMAMADLRARSLSVLRSNRQLAAHLKEVWQVLDAGELPAAAVRAASFLAEPGTVQTEVEQQYRQAAELYQKALRGVDRQVLWAYQGQLAAAYVRLYNLTRDPEDLSRARQALQDALKDKRHSPYLASLRRLESIAESQAAEQ